MKHVARMTNTMLVTWDSWVYLQNKMHEERSVTGKPLSEKSIARLRRGFEVSSRNGWRQICDYDFGGCNGSPVNAWEERRWTSWSVEDMARILDDAGLPHKESDPIEVIDVYF